MRPKIKFLYYWILSLLLLTTGVASAQNSNSCQIVHLPKFVSGTKPAFEKLSEDAARVQELLEKTLPSPKEQVLLERAWQSLEGQLHDQNWEHFYADKGLSETELARFEEIQTKRMSPSSTIQGKNTSDLKVDQAEFNWRSADRQVHDWVTSDTPLTIERMFKLNKIIGEKLYFNGSQAGQRRTIKVGIPYKVEGKDQFQAALEATNIDPMLRRFMYWFNMSERKLHPVQLAAQVYLRLNTIHPFPDGNGRTTRLIMDWVLRRRGYPPGVFMTTASTYVVIFPFDSLRRNPTPGFVENEVTLGLQWVADILNPFPLAKAAAY